MVLYSVKQVLPGGRGGVLVGGKIRDKSCETDDKVRSLGGNKLEICGLPAPVKDFQHRLAQEIIRETSYKESLQVVVNEKEPILVQDQKEYCSANSKLNIQDIETT
ncbi:Hypothetical predicted protein [Octopus vulgaris]|uniref:Uncharacterized protein n=1 Tax=Octopus vulgaris TaxID=6645 RepID=A0AA36EZV1_OCTVU|nr:Hypothetical predicted protein [Octopus vulgaris]